MVGIYPPSVCQNAAWEELDGSLVRGHLHLTAPLPLQYLVATGNISVGRGLW